MRARGRAVSVCLFHCELGGAFRRSECANVRPRVNKTTRMRLDDDDDVLRPYVEQDRVLFRWAEQDFFARVQRCRCTDLCDDDDDNDDDDDDDDQFPRE